MDVFVLEMGSNAKIPLSKKMDYKDHFRMGMLSEEFDEWLEIVYK